MANSTLRLGIRDVATWIATESTKANTTRSNMKYIQVLRVHGTENPYQMRQWMDFYWENAGGGNGTFTIHYSSHYSGDESEPTYFDKALAFGIGRRYFYADGSAYDLSLLTRASDFADDGSSDYYDTGTPPVDLPDPAPLGTGQDQTNLEISQAAPDETPTSRFTLNLPDFICKQSDARGWIEEWLGDMLASLEEWVKGLNDQVHSGEYIRQMCIERDLILGGYETTSQLQTLLKKWRQVMSLRGTEVGIIDEVNRIHNADDAAVEYDDFSWYLSVTHPGIHEIDDEVNPVVWNLPDIIQITVTHNNEFLWPFSEAKRVIRDKLIPVDLELKLIQEPPDEDALLGFGQSEFGDAEFGD